MRRLGLIALFGALPFWAYAQPADTPAPSIQALNRHITGIFSNKQFAAYPYAAEQYLELLRAVPAAADIEDRHIARRHLRYTGMVMAANDPARPVLDRLLSGGGGDIEVLVSWWHRQDPLPYSTNNERLQEHLMRIAFALEHYAHEDDERGFDDRGEIYVRLGAPARSKEIKIVSAGVWLNPYSARLPDNDFWVYRQIDKEAHYLFVRTSRRKPFKIATAEDLIPRELIASRRRIGLLLPILEEIFAQLALAHPHYGTTYDAVNSYLNVPGYSGSNTGAYQFVRRLMDKMRLDEDFYDRNRNHIIPVAFTNALGGAEDLAPALRWARFLEPGGQTRIELYWGLSNGALAPSRSLLRRLEREGHKATARYLVTLSVSRRDDRFKTQEVDTRHYSVSTTLGSNLRAQSWTTVSTEPLTHLAVQWEQRWAKYEDDSSISAGATLKIGTRTLDSLRALHADPSRLEMSDIKSLMVPVGGPLDDALFYPYEDLSHQPPAALYFEVYHLTYGEDDMARYSLEYRVESADDPSRAPITVGSSHSAPTRTAREHVSLDLSSWDVSGPLVITVRVTDEVSGQSIERAIRFNFAV